MAGLIQVHIPQHLTILLRSPRPLLMVEVSPLVPKLLELTDADLTRVIQIKRLKYGGKHCPSITC